jgi:hypothetical protein
MAKLPSLEEFSPTVKNRNQRRAALVKQRDEKKAEYLDAKAREKGVEEGHDERIYNVMIGEHSGTSTPDASAIASEAYNAWSDTHEAIELHDKLNRKVVLDASREYCATYLKAPQDAALKRLAAGLCEVYSAQVEYSTNRNQLWALGIEPIGLTPIAIDDLVGSYNDKQSKLAFLLRDLIAAGALSKLPVELR